MNYTSEILKRLVINVVEILGSQESNPTECNYDITDGFEPCALEFLVHFVGDVHQPLHVTFLPDPLIWFRYLMQTMKVVIRLK